MKRRQILIGGGLPRWLRTATARSPGGFSIDTRGIDILSDLTRRTPVVDPNIHLFSPVWAALWKICRWRLSSADGDG